VTHLRGLRIVEKATRLGGMGDLLPESIESVTVAGFESFCQGGESGLTSCASAIASLYFSSDAIVFYAAAAACKQVMTVIADKQKRNIIFPLELSGVDAPMNASKF